MESFATPLLVIHILGAVAGVGPSFAFGVLGRMAGEAGPAGVWLLTAQEKIEKKIVMPVALGVQPVTGLLLIFAKGYDAGFWQREWLVVGIAVWLAIAIIVLRIANPAVHRMIELAQTGQAQTPQFGALVGKMQKVGPLLTVMTVVLVVLMAWKPGN